jgi:hypothetical protein
MGMDRPSSCKPLGQLFIVCHGRGAVPGVWTDGAQCGNVDLDLIRLMSEIKTALLTARPPIGLQRHLFVSELRLNRSPFLTRLQFVVYILRFLFFSNFECEPNVESSLSVRNQSSLSLGVIAEALLPCRYGTRTMRRPRNTLELSLQALWLLSSGSATQC